VRRSKALAIAVVSLVLGAFSAGCSHVQGVQDLPVGASGSTQPASAMRSGVSPDLLNRGITRSEFLQLQLEGRLPAPIPLDVLRYDYEHQGSARPRLTFQAGAKVALWASDTNFNYLLGQDRSGYKTVLAIDVSKDQCYSPVALKVDHLQNLWVGCELQSDSGTNGAVQEYSSTSGLLERKYIPACPVPVAQCKSFSGYGWDSGVDANGNVFASLNLYSIETCTPTCVSSLSTGFEWWPAGREHATPRLISLGSNCSPVCGVGFMDVDASGNLWFTFGGYGPNNVFGFGLGEITNPTTTPAFTIVEPFGTYQFFGGVYVSDHGKTLNVIDQKARTISRYRLPLAPNGKPFDVLGPTLQNAFGVGDPTSGGFSQDDTKMAIGDAAGWLDLGAISRNTWSAIASPNFYSGIEGAAYTPSDK
jgi:hypothetical protein